MRECLPCTACCEGWLQINVNSEEIYPGKPCLNCNAGKGCKSYESRPVEPCQSFLCGWREEKSPLPDWFRPDSAKVIVLPNKFSWKGYAVDLAVPVGKHIPPRALNWLMQYAQKHQRLLVYMEQETSAAKLDKNQQCLAYGPPLFLQEIETMVRKGRRLWE